MLELERTLVRPQLEYFGLHYRKDVIALEGVERGSTRMLPGMEHFSYEETLRKLGLLSLEQRRLRGDLIEVYQIMRGKDRVDK